MSTQPKPYITEEQYFEIEESSDERHEYLRGEMFPMEASSLPHATITPNLIMTLGGQLKGSSCRVYTNTLRVAVSPTGLYTYPDIVVICGKPELSVKDKHKGTVTNPKVIVEILSPTTQTYDRGDKFRHYRSIPSFCEYLLVAQDQIQAEHHVKQPDGAWLLREINGPDAIISLDSIGVRFNLSEAYDGVELRQSA
jgi:Uma2 family endonuclease